MVEKTQNEIGEIIREMEDEYTRGSVSISNYVDFDMYFTINKIEAYLNSKHVSGQYDSQGREKPFFNIVTSASNIWYRATDIDRKNIRIKATKEKDIIDAFLATVHLQNWMTKEKFSQYLNEWGRVLARYGSAVTKFVETKGELNISVIPWNRIICDPIDFDSNPKIEVLEVTEAQLRRNKNYTKEQVDSLLSAKRAREMLDKRRKDDRNNYIKLYEIHGLFPLSYITKNEEDASEFVQQMAVVSYVKGRKKGEYEDFVLYSGREEKDPYRIAHLIPEDGRTLAIGSVEHLFQTQWMSNHSAKSIKDQLDLASKLVFQTSDGSFVGQNALTAIENGDILIHAVNQPLTQLANTSHDITSLQNQLVQWKGLGNEIVGISEAMLGAQPKAGTAWRQTEALLQESYSLFELMIENKANYLEDYLREYILPHIKRNKLNSSEEISATLDSYGIDWIDSRYIKNYSIKEANRVVLEKLKKGERVDRQQQLELVQQLQAGMKTELSQLGNQRFLKPSEVKSKTWKKQFENLEYELEIDISGENRDYQSMLATLNTALQVVATPGFEQNTRAKSIVDKILMASGTLSPIELSTIRTSPPVASPDGSSAGVTPTLPTVK